MPVTDDRVKQVVDYYCIHGEAKTCEDMDIPLDTLKRYQRQYKQKINPVIDDTVARIREKFTPEELSHLLEMDSKVPKINTVTHDFSGDVIKFLAITDTHYGSIYSDPSRTLSAFAEAERTGCDFMVHVGDVTEGLMNRPGSALELTHIGFKRQRDHSIEILSNWKKPMYLLSGNHDSAADSKLGVGLSVVEEICKEIPNATFVGEGMGTIEMNGVKIGLHHGIDGGASTYALSYRLQRIIQNMNPSQKPHVLLTGHDHKAFSLFYRNVHAVACGCLEKQTGWMAGKGLQAMEGFYIIEMCVRDSEVKWFQPRFYPFYV